MSTIPKWIVTEGQWRGEGEGEGKGRLSQQ